jgi:hypothetical protein
VKEGSMHSVTLNRAMAMGMLPTPNSRDWKDNIGNGQDAPSIGVTRGYSLGQKINSMLPTPTAQDADKATKKWREDHQNNLTAHVFNKMLPTPAMSNYKGASSIEALEARGRLKQTADNLADQFAVSGKSSQLSPQFVMEMMGFPTDWTLLPFLSGEQKASKPEEML